MKGGTELARGIEPPTCGLQILAAVVVERSWYKELRRA